MNIIEFDNFSISVSGKLLIPAFSLQIAPGTQWLVMGESGTGKTYLLHAIAGLRSHSGGLHISPLADGNRPKIVLVDQQHRFRNLSNTSSFYYQQRFNSGDSLDAATVEDEIRHTLELGSDGTLPVEAVEHLQLLHMERLLSTRLIQLSNGENKRLQLVKALLMCPDLLLLDNPFLGLDAEARQTLHVILRKITNRGIQLILSTSATELPDYLTNALILQKGQKPRSGLITQIDLPGNQKNELNGNFIHAGLFEKLVKQHHAEQFEYAVKMQHVNIRYEGRQILDNINWEVRRGEKWAISGGNGAGKSTLLSLVNADNPQAYANQVYLFDRKRGTGESIWEIKKKIGFVSPELHLYFDNSMTCDEVVASGLFDTIGLFRMINDAQHAIVSDWMHLLNIDHLKFKGFSRISTGEQRLVLLARALVKDAPLLILDEPCQGLDDHQIHHFKTLVDAICRRSDKTLLYVSHYKPEIPDCVENFLVLEDGKITNNYTSPSTNF